MVKHWFGGAEAMEQQWEITELLSENKYCFQTQLNTIRKVEPTMNPLLPAGLLADFRYEVIQVDDSKNNLSTSSSQNNANKHV